MSELRSNRITDIAGTASPIIPGAVLQMPFTQYSGTTEVSTNQTSKAVDVLTVSITPKSTSSIIKLDANIFHEWTQADASYLCMWFFYRDSTKLGAAQAGSRLCGITCSGLSYYASDASSTPEVASYSYFDTPSTTSLITYKVGVVSHHTTSVHINRTVSDGDSTSHNRGISFISATEIGG